MNQKECGDSRFLHAFRLEQHFALALFKYWLNNPIHEYPYGF